MEYTLDELVAAVAARLQAAGLQRQANGQVSAFPDRRTLRYYTTIGLMDRPDAVRDRQAIYGDRHVTQGVAVKRLQATGLALAAIQTRLAGLPCAEVEAIAAGRGVDGPATARRRPFWASPPSTTAAEATPGAAPMQATPGAAPMQGTPGAAPMQATPAASPGRESGARPMLAIPLAAHATLLLATDQPLTTADITGIRASASALLDYLDHLSAAVSTGADIDRKDH